MSSSLFEFELILWTPMHSMLSGKDTVFSREEEGEKKNLSRCRTNCVLKVTSLL